VKEKKRKRKMRCYDTYFYMPFDAMKMNAILTKQEIAKPYQK
jgi:hypothetical protein